MDQDNWTEQLIKGDLLDELMAEIPGKDGYGNTLTDEGIDGFVAKVSVCYCISEASKLLTIQTDSDYKQVNFVCNMRFSPSYVALSFLH